MPRHHRTISLKTGQEILVPYTAEEEAAADAYEAQYVAEADTRQLKEIRELREPLLQNADIQIFKHEDEGIDATAWRNYRVSLRNITDQSDIYNIVWPTKPVEI